MGKITIINLSTLTDCVAVILIGKYLAGDEYHATHSEDGSQVINIKKQRENTYLITDVI